MKSQILKKVVIYLTPSGNDGHIIYYQLLQHKQDVKVTIKKDYSI